MTARHQRLLRPMALLCALAFGVTALAPGSAVAETPPAGSLVLPALPFPPSPPSFAVDPAAGIVEASAAPTAETICQVIAANALAVGMPEAFFARLIWKESRFDAAAVSPVGAQGIAQFMPYTAEERGLADPYDMRSAIRHSALYLSDLRAELGNWGLAAAAYNGGINRVKRWIANGGGPLPYETEAYVADITARPADWFREAGREIELRPLDPERNFQESCARLPIMKTRAIFASLDGEESAPMRPWGVQVAGHEQRAVAMRMFERVRASHPGLVKEAPIVLRKRTGPRRTIYAVRLGADSRGEANTLCQQLRGAGGACIVMKN
ncbi:transglycosylase SLT domain-containing protein [Aurantimonas aggregata]|uniref:Transglycosylase SLT domain-containing protein n=1 Tax=Aurantimonas aggregata TaxID=2047720 RepID=A0A6L9MI55_9HYPH|nr:lytic transglycosylase domain-containing protein [Aurantimonas aggregata]NDV87346.1 transglycosylase SLT domain-containing protein [Aurantimonas aggregata]